MSFREYVYAQIKGIGYILLYTIASLFFTGFIGFIVDKAIETQNLRKLLAYTFFMLCSGLVMIVFQYLQKVYYYKLGQKIVLGIRQKILNKLMDTNNNFWGKNSVGDMFTIFERDINQIENLLTSVISDVFINIFVVIGISCFLFYTDAQIAILCICMSFLFAILQKKVGNNIQLKTTHIRNMVGKINGFANEILDNANGIQVCGYKQIIFNTYTDKQITFIKDSTQLVKIRSLSQSVSMAYNILGNCLVLLIGGYKVYIGSITVGTLLIISIYTAKLYSPIVALANIYSTVKNTIPMIHKVLSILGTRDTITGGEYKSNSQVQGNIAIRNLSYSYGEELIFKNANLEVTQGDIVGIVGENGSGKTTLFRLLTRLCDYSEGDILIDDKDIKEIDVEYFRAQVGCMLQNTFLLSGTLREIVIPANTDISDKNILEVMKLVCFKINEFSSGLDTVIGEKQYSLSGGQAQKLILVRIFLSNMPILLLDEPTSALDIESEQLIVESFKKLVRNKTVIIVTHRQELLKLCGKVIAIKDKEFVPLTINDIAK